ncbi:methyltransferase domain-containing protein [Candidatus Thorarchaeota archaeon]|nr:MAG: methyltransferase domain-containing protein [Candidatus Thorarchaeota archaeon]
MDTLVLILGKNWILSIAELIAYFETRGITISVVDYSRNSVIVDVDKRMDDQAMVDLQSALGGCYKTGRLVTTKDKGLVISAFPKRGSFNQDTRKKLLQCPWIQEVWPRPKGQSIHFGVSTYPADKNTPIHLKRFTLGMDEGIKKTLQKNGVKKAAYVAYEEPDRRKEDRPNTALWPQTIARHGLLRPPNAEILAAFTHNALYIGKSVAVYDSMLQRYRDESRPFISTEISTSPKLCRTLLTLAAAKPGDTVLDPFCGTGTLLMEAALLGMRCVGIDLDANAVQGTISNLKWLGRELEEHLDFRILHGDARESEHLVAEKVDAIAFEPYLGPLYEKRPAESEAVALTKDLAKLYRDSLNSLAAVLRHDGKIAMTIPVINSKAGKVRIDLDQMLSDTPFRIHKMLPGGVFKEDPNKDTPSMIRPNRDLLPERKWGQVVQRQVLTLNIS